MKTKKKRKNSAIKIILSLLVIAGISVLILGLVNARKPGSTPVTFLAPPMPGSEAADYLEAQRPVYTGATPIGSLIAEALNRAWDCRTEGEPKVDTDSAEQAAVITRLRTTAFLAGVDGEMQQELEQIAAGASRRSEIYDEDGAWLPELVEQSVCAVLERRMQELPAFTEEESLTIPLRYANEQWLIGAETKAQEAVNPDALAEQLLADCIAAAQPVQLHYAIPEDVKIVSPAPEENFHVSADPMEIAALLDTAEARALIGDRELVWNPELELLEDSQIYLYLDETLLVIVWQQVEGRPVGTFSEIIISDGSQLRRKVAADRFDSNANDFKTTSGYAKEVNGVLTLGGDFYNHHQRVCGITVLDGIIYRFSPLSADTCMITEDGDMLFVYHHQYQNEEKEAAQQYVTENNVVFSLAFGPVLIDDGQDVTPEWYRWGEINDRYARSALGMLGEKHYLTVNLNCTDRHYYLATLQEATDALLSRGCVKGYALDGGQTATTVFHGKLINLVQFGWEKPISDVIYFVSALPAE